MHNPQRAAPIDICSTSTQGDDRPCQCAPRSTTFLLLYSVLEAFMLLGMSQCWLVLPVETSVADTLIPRPRKMFITRSIWRCRSNFWYVQAPLGRIWIRSLHEGKLQLVSLAFCIDAASVTATLPSSVCICLELRTERRHCMVAGCIRHRSGGLVGICRPSRKCQVPQARVLSSYRC